MLVHSIAAAAASALLVLTAPAAASDAGAGTTTLVVARQVDRHPASAKAARVALQRLGDAALEACGASSFSLREVQDDVRASPCWRRSMADAVARIGDPMLTAVYATLALGHHGSPLERE